MGDQRAYYEYMGFPAEWLRERYRPYAERFPRGAEVLDLACGRGEFLELLAPRGINGLGVDSDPGMVEEARSRGLEVVESDVIRYLEGQEARFDGIFSAHLIEHLQAETVEKMVQAAAKALRPRGRLIVVSPNSQNLHMLLSDFWIDLQHVRPYHPATIGFLLHQAGFREIETGINEQYRLRPDLAEPGVPDLPPPRPKTLVIGRRRLSAMFAPSLEARLTSLEGRVNALIEWVRSLYPAGEFFATGVR